MQKSQRVLVRFAKLVEVTSPLADDPLQLFASSNAVCASVERQVDDYVALLEDNMPDALTVAPHVNGVLETSLYVESAARSAEFYGRVFGFGVIAPAAGEGLDHNTRLCAMRAGDRSVLLLFKRGGTPDTDAQGAIHIAFGISRSDLRVWEDWLGRLGIAIESRKRWEYGAEALYFRDPDGHLLEVVTPGVWEIY